MVITSWWIIWLTSVSETLKRSPSKPEIGGLVSLFLTLFSMVVATSKRPLSGLVYLSSMWWFPLPSFQSCRWSYKSERLLLIGNDSARKLLVYRITYGAYVAKQLNFVWFNKQRVLKGHVESGVFARHFPSGLPKAFSYLLALRISDYASVES